MKRVSTNPWCWVPSLYFTEGLPNIIVAAVAAIMYKRMGLSNADVTFYASLLTLPWVIKPLWSPFVDIFSTRRRWVTAMQFLMAIGFAAVGFSMPGQLWFQFSTASFMAVAFLSAPHDIAADGFYMLALSQERQSFFVGIRTATYRLAMIAGRGPLVMLAGYLETTMGDIPEAWAATFYIVAIALTILAAYHSLILPHPASDKLHQRKTPTEVCREFIATFREFFTKPGIVTAVLFMLFYKLPEAMLTSMINPFLLDPAEAGGLGLDTGEVGIAYGTVGVVGLMLGGIIGGMVVSRNGLRRWMMPMAWGMSLTCATFLWLSYAHASGLIEVCVCVFIEQFGYGFGTTAYILYLIHFAKGAKATSFYAIATGIMSLGMMLPGMISGWLQTMIGYGPFFIVTMVCCVVTILVAKAARRHIESGK